MPSWLRRIFEPWADRQERQEDAPLDRGRALAQIHAPGSSWVTKIEAIEFLKDQSGPDIVEALEAALGRPSVIGWDKDHVRLAALENLGHLAPHLAEPFLTYDSGDVRSAAAAVLHRARPETFGPPSFAIVVFRPGQAPEDPQSYAESLLKRKVAAGQLRAWRVVGVRALLPEDQSISLYHQMVRERSLPDLGPARDAWRDAGPDGVDCVALLFD